MLLAHKTIASLFAHGLNGESKEGSLLRSLAKQASVRVTILSRAKHALRLFKSLRALVHYYQAQGISVPAYDERLRCYQCYIGLDALRFSAKSNQPNAYRWARKRIIHISLLLRPSRFWRSR